MPPSANERPRWLLPAVAFGVGLLIGWWVIGWGVWPVRWTNSLPPDLRAAERDEYLVMVAESFNSSGNLAMAQSRLNEWPEEKLRDDLLRLQDRLASENPLQAAQVQQLGGLLGLYGSSAAAQAAAIPRGGSAQEVEQPEGEPEAEPEPVTAPGSTPSEEEKPPLWRRICIGAIWVLVAAVGIFVILAMYRRWRLASDKQGVAGDITYQADSVEPAGSSWAAGLGDEEGASSKSAPWDESPSVVDSDLADWRTSATVLASDRGTTKSKKESARVGPPVAPSVAHVKPDVHGMRKVTDFSATYRAGEMGYDETFTILDSDGVQLGECGVSLADPIGQGRDEAIAFHLWLFDMKDSFTKLEVLMAESTYRDTSRREMLADRSPAVAIRLGTETGIETAQLALLATVESLEFTSQGPSHGMFAELGLRLQVYKR